jgi:hypothetical protein
MDPTAAVVREESAPEPRPLRRIRTVLALLASATAVGGLIELAMLRHWGEATQLVPWVALVAVAVVGVLTARGGSTRLAQATGAAAAVAGAIGVVIHLSENLDYGEDLAQYAQTWETTPFLERLWLVLNGTVVEAPTLAPGMVALSGVILVIAVLDRR